MDTMDCFAQRRLSVRCRNNPPSPHRYACPMTNGVFGRLYAAEGALPQGSVLSPFLFNCYTLPLLVLLGKIAGVRAILYADDIAVVADMNKIEAVMETVAKWAAENGMSINNEKSFIIVKKGRRMYRAGGLEIAASSCPQKYLGVKVDAGLTMTHHIEEKVKSLRKLMNALVYARVPSGEVRKILSALIHGTLFYGVGAWGKCVTEGTWGVIDQCLGSVVASWARADFVGKERVVAQVVGMKAGEWVMIEHLTQQWHKTSLLKKAMAGFPLRGGPPKCARRFEEWVKRAIEEHGRRIRKLRVGEKREVTEKEEKGMMKRTLKELRAEWESANETKQDKMAKRAEHTTTEEAKTAIEVANFGVGRVVRERNKCKHCGARPKRMMEHMMVDCTEEGARRSREDLLATNRQGSIKQIDEQKFSSLRELFVAFYDPTNADKEEDFCKKRRKMDSRSS